MTQASHDDEIGVVTGTHPLDETIEAAFRDLIVGYCEVLTSPEVRKYEEYGRGMVWGAVHVLTAMGYGDWAHATVQSELEEFQRTMKSRKGGFFGYLESGAFSARTRRLLLPGNSFVSRTGNY